MAITTLDQVIRQGERIKNYFENELNSGEIQTINGETKFIYKYRNEETPTILQGVDSAEILSPGKNVSVPATSSTVTVCGSGFYFDFQGGTVSLASGVSDSSIMGAATIYGNGGGNLYQADNSTIYNYTDNDTIFSSDDDALNAANSLGTAYYFLNSHTIRGEKNGNYYDYLGVGDYITFQNSNGDFSNLMVTLNLYAKTKNLESTKTFPSWEEIKLQKGSETAADNRSVFTGGSYYKSGKSNRVEASLLNGQAFASSKGNPYNTGVDQTTFDDLFISIQNEMNTNLALNEDADLKINAVSGDWDYGDTLANNYQYSYRIHFPVIIVKAYPVRSGKSAPDSLYAFIEQEPIKQEVTLSDSSTFTREDMSSVRQIIINNDIANTGTYDRPLVFFYEGPEVPLKKYHPELYDGDDYVGARPFLPIILNLYANFRGIIFAPNNPVIINGNGFKLEGFVVAREFRRLKTWKDFQNAKYSSGSDSGKPVYVYSDVATYKNNASKNAPFYAQVSNWKVKNSSSTSGYVQIKVNFGGTWYNAWVKDNQWYSSETLKDPNEFIQIEINGDQNYYAYFKDILLEVNLDANDEVVDSGGTTYVAQFDGRFYTPVTTESVTYSSSTYVGEAYSGGSVIFRASNKTITQKVNTMYVFGTRYTYTETYLNTEGVTKTKQTIMSIGDVAYEYVSPSDCAVEGSYSETPLSTPLADDDKLRYDYVNVFNLNADSIFNSFNNLSIYNYTYLNSDSHDMFFTTARFKHID